MVPSALEQSPTPVTPPLRFARKAEKAVPSGAIPELLQENVSLTQCGPGQESSFLSQMRPVWLSVTVPSPSSVKRGVVVVVVLSVVAVEVVDAMLVDGVVEVVVLVVASVLVVAVVVLVEVTVVGEVAVEVVGVVAVVVEVLGATVVLVVEGGRVSFTNLNVSISRFPCVPTRRREPVKVCVVVSSCAFNVGLLPSSQLRRSLTLLLYFPFSVQVVCLPSGSPNVALPVNFLGFMVAMKSALRGKADPSRCSANPVQCPVKS